MTNIFDINKLLGLDEKTAQRYVSVLVGALRDVREIKELLSWHLGDIPEDGIEGWHDPLIVDETVRTVPKAYELKELFGGKAGTGHIKNVGSEKMKVRWDVGGSDNWLPPYTLEPGEVLEWEEDRVRRIEVRPYEEGQEYEYKMYFR